MGKWISPNLSQAEDFECLGHSNWTICSHLLISDFQNLMKSCDSAIHIMHPNMDLEKRKNGKYIYSLGVLQIGFLNVAVGHLGKDNEVKS